MKLTAFYKRCIALAALISCTCVPLLGTAAYEKLQKGDTGEAVFKLEEAMAMQGFFDAWPDQTYDDATAYAVKAFQEKNGLTADGIAGNDTLTLLYGALLGEEETNTPDASGSSVQMPSELRNLSLNKQGDDVTSLQTRLTELGYYTGRISGSFGKLTGQAVEAFQKANGLTADGIAGIKTQTKIYSASAIPASAASTGSVTDAAPGSTGDTVASAGVIYETLRSGSNSEGVRQMQLKLKELGYYSGNVTGNFGNVTWEAVKAFQKASGLKADGVAGQKTLEKLYNTASPETGATDVPSLDAGTSSDTAVDTSNADTTLTLRVGTNSDAVKQMQQRLKELGYYSGNVTGNFGNVTWEAVRKFQKAKGLTADGVAGPKTLAALYATATGSANTNTSTSVDTITVNATLRVGSRGSDVKDMQKRLKELGYLIGSADGVFGTGTETALKAFQTANALTSDGVAGPKTLNRLNSSSAVAAAAGSSSGASSSVAKNDTSTTLRHDMKDMQQIRDMQTRLAELGYYTGSITGNFGDLTLKAVKAFQTANSLSADGVAGKNTLTKLYSSGALKASASSSSSSSSSSGTSSSSPSGFPKASQVQNVNWYSYIRPYYKAGTVMQIYDFENKLTWQCVMMSNGKHSDSQPRTAEDTEIMYKAFGNKNTWTPKAVWIKMPDGKVFLASMHNMPHLSGSIKDNNFDGHLCIHFPREMKEAEETGPYAVSHQKEIIKGWEKTQKLAAQE